MDAGLPQSSSSPTPTPLPSCLIVGCGYVGSRLARQQAGRQPALAVVRTAASETGLQAAGVNTLRLDFDHETEPALRRSLATAAEGAAIVYLVPPPDAGTTDPRLESFLRQLGDAKPTVLVYMSTSGVYGDAAGATVDETSPLAAANDRSRRRVAAEATAMAWSGARGVRCVILRAPGIYGPHRLPLERLRRGEPALRPEDAGPGNRIHVDDLISCIAAAIVTDSAQGAYNVTDGDHASTTEYLRATAAAAGLQEPPLVSKSEARERISPGMLAFLLESRHVDNRRMREELNVRLRYPRMREGISASLAEMRLEDAAP